MTDLAWTILASIVYVVLLGWQVAHETEPMDSLTDEPPHRPGIPWSLDPPVDAH